MGADFTVEPLGPIVEAAVAELRSRSTTEKLAIVGASMGAAWAFDLAESEPDRVHAVVAYDGISEADWGRLEARVLHHFGDRDRLDPLADAEAMQRDLVEAGVDATLEVYAGADHRFAEPGRPEHDPEAAELAWRRTVELLRV